MGKKDDLDPMGAIRNIADLVNDAISSGDYSSLNRQITEALNEAADAVHDSVTGAVFGNKPFYKTEGGKTYRAESGSSYQQAQEKARHTDGFKEARDVITGSDGVASPAGAYVQTTLGGIGTMLFSLPMIAAFAMIGEGGGMFFFAIFLAAVTAVSGWNLFKGLRKLGMMKRARKVLKMMENRDTITVREIASAFGKDEKWIADDLQNMMREGVFTGKAYMDKEETAYWLGMAMHRRNPRRVLCALRILLTAPLV